MLDTLVLALIWTFNIAAVVLTIRADLLKRVVLGSWELILGLVVLELGYSLWAVFTGQPPAVMLTAGWLGLNLVLTVNVAMRNARRLAEGQIAILCSWWIALVGMMVAAVQQAGHL